MAYDDEAYQRATRDLRNAVDTLLDNDVDGDDIVEMVEEAIQDHE